jgi:hypothetical protein
MRSGERQGCAGKGAVASSDRGSTRWSHALVLLQELLVICHKRLRDIDLRSREPFHASTPLFKWHHFTAQVILCAVRWSLRYALSYRDVKELLRERDAEAAEHSFRKVLGATHTTLPRVITVDNNAAYPPPSMRYGMTGR